MNGFLESLRADPLDMATWNAYHDWLEDHQKPSGEIQTVLEIFQKQKGRYGVVSRFHQDERVAIAFQYKDDRISIDKDGKIRSFNDENTYWTFSRWIAQKNHDETQEEFILI